MPTGPAIGIDLGTSFSCVGVFMHDRVEIVANDQGNRTTPSCVAFTDRERLFGEAALNQMAMNPTNTVFDVKRLIGRTFDDEAVQDDMKHWPFKVINSQGTPKIEVEYRGEKKHFAAEEISAMVLQKMKETAETYLGKRVRDAVIAVPAYFNSRQRQATLDAGKIAGLNVLRLINEPTAAAIAYGVKKRSERQHNVLVFDWGGGTLDVSILSIENGAFEVKAVGGDTHLGGEDITSRLVNHCVEEFKQMHEGRDLTACNKAINRLRKACETAKRNLSILKSTNVEVVSLFEDIDFCLDLTRAQFERLCLDLFCQTMDVVKSALSASKMERTDIDEILLVGGSTRIPRVQTMLREYFNGRVLNRSLNPDEAVAYGATLMAAQMSSRKKNSTTPNNCEFGLSEEEIKRMINDAKKMKLEDEEERSRMAAKNVLVGYIYSIKAKMESEEVKQMTSKAHRKELIRMCEEMMKWTDTERNATKKDYERKKQELENKYNSITKTKKSRS
ncbi:heat shock protein 70 [Echinococcus multilocularis]|uniref:Heat shock protein 70 n=1 Tax=Echinococcus multilocularis TaxID=6211 RepID=A0A068Y943_ECHMU|nr:heat shock protein 70 [Echinococcus multilocularis]